MVTLNEKGQGKSCAGEDSSGGDGENREKKGTASLGIFIDKHLWTTYEENSNFTIIRHVVSLFFFFAILFSR